MKHLFFTVMGIGLIFSSCTKDGTELRSIQLTEDEIHAEKIKEFKENGLPYDETFEAEVRFSEKNKATSFSHEKAYSAKPRIKIRHHGLMKPGEPATGGCDQPLGLCIILSVAADQQLTPIERLDGWAYGSIEIYNQYSIKLIPDTYFSIDNTLEIESAISLGDELSNLLGVSNAYIKAGVYPIDVNEGPFGSVILDIQHQ